MFFSVFSKRILTFVPYPNILSFPSHYVFVLSVFIKDGSDHRWSSDVIIKTPVGDVTASDNKIRDREPNIPFSRTIHIYVQLYTKTGSEWVLFRNSCEGLTKWGKYTNCTPLVNGSRQNLERHLGARWMTFCWHSSSLYWLARKGDTTNPQTSNRHPVLTSEPNTI